MENVLPKWSTQLDSVDERSMPNAQWQPARATYKPGTMLPARLRMLVQLSQDEDELENPRPTVVSRTLPLEEQAVGGAEHNFASPYDASDGADPSPLGFAARGLPPPPVAVRAGEVPLETPAWSPTKERRAAPSTTAAKAGDLSSAAAVPLFTVMHDAEPSLADASSRRFARLLPEAASQVRRLPSSYGAVDRGMLGLFGVEGDDDEYEEGGGGGGEGGGLGYESCRPNVMRVVDVYVRNSKGGTMAHHEVTAGDALVQPAAGGPRLLAPPEALLPHARATDHYPTPGRSGGNRGNHHRAPAPAAAAIAGLSVLYTTRARLRRRSVASPGPLSPHPRSRLGSAEVPAGDGGGFDASGGSGNAGASEELGWDAPLLGFDGELPDEVISPENCAPPLPTRIGVFS